MTDHQHLHRDDYPATVAFLTDVWGDRPEVVIDVTDVGVKVNWAGEGLSSTEAAVLDAVRVLCRFESTWGTSGPLVPKFRRYLMELLGS